VLFTKLIRILIGVLVVWLILQFLLQLGRKKSAAHRMKQGGSSHTRRKFVESNVVEDSSRTEDKTQS
jgi:hypothetical protein